MQFTYEEKCLVKNSSNHLYGPNSPDLNPLITLCEGLGSTACILYSILISNMDDLILKDKVRTCWENLDQQIIIKSLA